MEKLMKLGYARVSAKDQNPARQIEKFKQLGIDDHFIFLDKQSGKNFNRAEYQAMKGRLREGDILYLDSLNRLGRDYDGIINEWKDITRNIGADIIVLDNEGIFDSQKFRNMGAIGKMLEDQFLSILSYLADQVRQDIRRTQREGIDLALAQKRPYGRPKFKVTDKFRQAYLQWKKGKITAVKAMKMAEVKASTFYKHVKTLDEEYKGVNLFDEK